MDDQEAVLARTRQLGWLIPVLATLLLVCLELYYFFVKHMPFGDVVFDLVVGSAIAWGLSCFAFKQVLTVQRAAVDRAREVADLNLIASRLSATGHLQDILSISLDGLLQMSGSDAGGIYLRHGKTWRLAIQRGIPDEALRSATTLPEDDPWIRAVLQAGQTFVRHEDWGNGEEELVPPDVGYSYFGLASFAKGEAVAIILLSTRKGESLSPGTLRLLPPLATQVGMALERGHLLEEAQQRLRERELLLQTVQEIASYPDLDALLPRIISSAMQAIPLAEKGSIHLYDKTRDELVVRASVGFGRELWNALTFKPGEGCAGWVYLHQQPVLFADMLNDCRYKQIGIPKKGTRSGICAPLVTQGKAIGTLSLDNPSRCEAFDEDDLRLLTAFASSAAVAIERANALEDAQRLAAESGMLLIIGQLLASCSGFDEVSRHTVEEGAGLLQVDACSLALYDPATELLTVRAVDGLDRDDAKRLAVPMDCFEGAREAIRGGLPVAVEDAFTDERVPTKVMRALGIRSTLIAPLFSRGSPVGILAFHQTETRRLFSEEDKQLALQLGYQAATAIENARLFARVDRARQEWELTFNAISDAIFIVDREATITQANEPAAKLAGRPLPELVGHRYDSMISGCDEPPDACVLADVLRSGRPTRAETSELLAEGVYQVSNYPLRDAHGEVQGAVSILHDVTVEQRLRQQLLHAEKLSSLGQTIAGVAHELNNPLQAVVGYSELLRTSGNVSEEFQKDVDRIYEAGRRAASIVRNLLTFARKHDRQRKEIDLNQSIRSVLNLRTNQLETVHVAVVTDLGDDLPLCYADRHQLQQVWHNLILNAEQAMLEAHGAGVLAIRTLLKDADTLRVEFIDDGPGIPKKIMGRIFDPFFTTKRVGEGTGLGLAVCFGIVRAHGGTIWAESENGNGTTFVVELPIRDPQA